MNLNIVPAVTSRGPHQAKKYFTEVERAAVSTLPVVAGLSPESVSSTTCQLAERFRGVCIQQLLLHSVFHIKAFSAEDRAEGKNAACRPSGQQDDERGREMMAAQRYGGIS